MIEKLENKKYGRLIEMGGLKGVEMTATESDLSEITEKLNEVIEALNKLEDTTIKKDAQGIEWLKINWV